MKTAKNSHISSVSKLIMNIFQKWKEYDVEAGLFQVP